MVGGFFGLGTPVPNDDQLHFLAVNVIDKSFEEARWEFMQNQNEETVGDKQQSPDEDL